MAEEIENPVADFKISIEKDDDYEFSPEVSSAIEALAEAISAEESDVAGFAFGEAMTFGTPSPMGMAGFKLGPIVICGCDDGANCRCNGGSFSKAFEVESF